MMADSTPQSHDGRGLLTEAGAGSAGTPSPIEAVTIEQVLALLSRGEMEVLGLLPWSSNYTFLTSVRDGEMGCLAVYKPRQGERPLWDFPQGTLYLREVAAYVVSQALGWGFVPPTVLRDGPHGVGAVQLFIEAQPEAHYFTLGEGYASEARRIAAFDCVINNADRKAGHCLLDRRGRLWVVDHGIAFHAQPKLRTVIWDFAGQPIPPDMVRDLQTFRHRLTRPDPLVALLDSLLADEERAALRQRLDALLNSRTFPHPGPGRHVPWPPI